LRAAGFDPQHVNGVMDERTAGAVRAFQGKSGLPRTGQVDAATWRKLRDARMEARTATSPSQHLGERSAAVMRTEKLLQKVGMRPGRVDGLFDARTQAAVRRFERKHHRPVDGKVNTSDLKALRKAAVEDLGPTFVTNGYNAGRPYKLKVARVEGKLVEEHVARAFKRMEAAARRDGVELNIVSGFRTMAEQQELYRRYKAGTGNLAAVPGYSNHQNGRALDLNVQTGSSDAVGVGRVYNWLARHAGQYGFRRIPAEAWHWEYQGKVGL
jgi:peptidoglycan hydrolase-like protein with peptidoglycan-binding domain